MNMTYLAIENDLEIHERESQFWLSRRISSIRVTTMNEGIALAKKTQFYYIGINAANVNYLQKLPHLRAVTNAPIFVSTSDELYCTSEQSKAINAGADLYGKISKDPSENYNTCVAKVNSLRKRAEEIPLSINDIVVCGNVLMSRLQRKAYVEDRIIELSAIDFDLMFLLVKNPGIVFTSEQLYNHAWPDTKSSLVASSVKNAIKRIRQKFDDAKIIENAYGAGYKFPSAI